MNEKAMKRLQALWDELYPDEPVTIKKEILKPRSRGAVGWRWTATSSDNVRADLGYSEQEAINHIRRWNDPMVKAVRQIFVNMERVVWMGVPYDANKK